MHFEVPILLENTINWFNRISSLTTRQDIVMLENDAVVAMGGLTNIDQVLKKAELYIFVDPNIQGSGWGTKATKLLCKYGFEDLNLQKIYLETNEDNIKAQRVYEKCDFVLEGRLRNEYLAPDGTYKSRFYYGLLKDEFHD